MRLPWGASSRGLAYWLVEDAADALPLIEREVMELTARLQQTGG